MCAAERDGGGSADVAGNEDEFQAPEKGSATELLDANAHDELDPMRHSAAHVMAEAVMELFPEAKLGIGPAIKDGFYYDFDLPRALTPQDLKAIEKRMKKSVGRNHPFERREWDPDEGRAMLEAAGQTYKVEILDDLRTAADAAGEPAPTVSTYSHGPFTDLCRGPHVESTGKLGPFKLLKVSGAYWRGDEKRPMLQRIYGTVWSSRDELDLYLWRLEEARKRDHRRVGVALDLFSFHDVSPGSAFWHPKGQRLWRTLETAVREVQDRRDYQEVGTPILVHKKLWEQSGHWNHYDDKMFTLEVEDAEGEPDYSLKPMNCPLSTIIYNTRVRSYRDLPLRFSDFGDLHRNELSGTLSGLTRIRHFRQDDAHCYVRPDQLADEVEGLLGEIQEVFGWFGLTPRFSFATRPDKALGDPALWEQAETYIREALERAGVEYQLKPKDGAFYAPKIDGYVEDALGREWQLSTIQADLVMLPERFDLTYIDEEGQQQRPIAVHRAILGSFERFIGIITEHFGGAFPLWCAPVQATIIPIADRHNEAAAELAEVLRSRKLFVDLDDSGNRMQKKIKLAQDQKIPYMLVLGDREVESRTAAPRTRAGEQLEPIGWEELADQLAEQVASKRPD